MEKQGCLDYISRTLGIALGKTPAVRILLWFSLLYYMYYINIYIVCNVTSVFGRNFTNVVLNYSPFHQKTMMNRRYKIVKFQQRSIRTKECNIALSLTKEDVVSIEEIQRYPSICANNTLLHTTLEKMVVNNTILKMKRNT